MFIASLTVRHWRTKEVWSNSFSSKDEAVQWLNDAVNEATRKRYRVISPKIERVITLEEQFGFLTGNDLCAAEWQTP